MKKIIGFAGRKRSGKTTMCKHLHDSYGATIVTIANALKQLCCDLLVIDTIEELNELKDNPDVIINLFQENKSIWTMMLMQALSFNDIGIEEKQDELYDIVSKFIDKKQTTVRDLIQFVGTEIIRHFQPDWHVKRMIETINKAETDLVVIDDVRFPNEKEAIESMGGNVFFIIRPDLDINISNHSSETSLHWQDFSDNRIIVNMHDLDTVFKEFDESFKYDFNLGTYSFLFKSGLPQFSEYNNNLGYKPNCSKEEESFIKENLIENLSNDGAFILFARNEDEIKKFEKFIYHKVFMTTQFHVYSVWNPFIIENLKEWL